MILNSFQIMLKMGVSQIPGVYVVNVSIVTAEA